MSLLQSEPGVVYYPTLAKRTSVNAAILAQQIYYWQCRDGVGIIHEGQRWIYNSYEDWSEQLGMSVDRVRGAVLLLEKIGALTARKLKAKSYDHTKYYRINPEHEVFRSPVVDCPTTSDSSPTEYRVFPDQSSILPESLKTEITTKITSDIGSAGTASAAQRDLSAFEPVAERLAALMLDHCAREGYQISNPQPEVVKIIDQIERLDGIPAARLEAALRWAVADPFWSTNVRSLLALRKKSKSNGLPKIRNVVTAWQEQRGPLTPPGSSSFPLPDPSAAPIIVKDDEPIDAGTQAIAARAAEIQQERNCGAARAIQLATAEAGTRARLVKIIK